MDNAVDKPDNYSLPFNWSADMMGMMTLVRVLPGERYDKIQTMKRSGAPPGPRRSPRMTRFCSFEVTHTENKIRRGTSTRQPRDAFLLVVTRFFFLKPFPFQRARAPYRDSWRAPNRLSASYRGLFW
jgi:hypothetical protein